MATMLLKLTPAAGALVRVRELAVSVVRLPRMAEGEPLKLSVLVVPVATLSAVEERLSAAESGAKAAAAKISRAAVAEAWVIVTDPAPTPRARAPAAEVVGPLYDQKSPEPPPVPVVIRVPLEVALLTGLVKRCM